jgi:hypothetical protein
MAMHVVNIKPAYVALNLPDAVVTPVPSYIPDGMTVSARKSSVVPMY